MAVVWVFLGALVTNIWAYLGGPFVVADSAAQMFIRPYKQWAESHGPLRRWLLALAAIAGVLWASFAAFQDQYIATRTTDAQRNYQLGRAEYWRGVATGRQQTIDDLNKRPPQMWATPLASSPPAPVMSPRDPDALYQLDRQVATVSGAQIDLSHGAVIFTAIKGDPTLNPAKPLEYREWVIHCPDIKSQDVPGVRVFNYLTGPSVYGSERCEILRKRQ